MTSLIDDGDITNTWYSANHKLNRFYVINLVQVITRLHVDHTTSKPYFVKAEKLIRNEKRWRDQYPFPYESGHAQIFPNSRLLAKLFGHAVTIIVAMEMKSDEVRENLAAGNENEKGQDINVYDWLRILPAHYFVEGFTAERLKKLELHHSEMSEAKKTAAFGTDSKLTFQELCSKKIGQSPRKRFLHQLSTGHCGTKDACTRLINFVNQDYFPKPLHIGPLRSSGDETDLDERLGRKNASPDMSVVLDRLNKNGHPELAPCF